jgi:hypothetical protein
MVVATPLDERARTADPVSGRKLSRAETSRRNGSISRGPRTQAGKDKSRFNAVTHGMTARSDVLPGENPSGFETARLALHESMNPHTVLETIMVDRIARNAWRAERTEVAADARVDYAVNHDALDRAHAQKQQVITLSQLLLADLFERAFIRPEARAGGAEHPAQLVALLETTIPGCDWLLGRLRTLECYLPRPGAWVEIHGFQLARLMGHYVRDYATEYDVADVLLASEVVTGDTKVFKEAQIKAAIQARAAAKARTKADASAGGGAEPDAKSRKQARVEKPDDLADVDVEEVTLSMGRVVPKREFVANLVKLQLDAPREITHMNLDRLVPDNAALARQRLAEVISQMIARLESIQAMLTRVADADAATAAARLEVDLSHEGDLQHRYIVARDRALVRSIDTFYKLRKGDNDGTVEKIAPDQSSALIYHPIDPPSPDGSLIETSAAAPVLPGEGLRQSAAPQPGLYPPDAPLGWAEIPPIIEERLTQTVFREEFDGKCAILRNEPEKPCPAAGPEPPPEPQASEIAAPPLAAIVPDGPPAPVVTAVAAAPSLRSADYAPPAAMGPIDASRHHGMPTRHAQYYNGGAWLSIDLPATGDRHNVQDQE